LSQIEQHLGQRLISDLDQRRVLDYVRVRQVAGASGRTINAELGELSRAIGRTWRELWPRVKKLEENMGVGKALTSEEEARLLKAADDNRSRLSVLIRVALQTGMRAGELTSLQWRQVDFEKKLITVGKAKTANGTGRIIPMNPNLAAVLSVHADWYRKRFEEVRPEWFVFPFGSPYPSDPARPTVELKTAWNTVRSAAGVSCRWHDLRHTACTKMAEAGVSEGTMLAIMGHMSRAMLERYSHIRMAAKREAVESLALSPNVPNSKPISTVSTTVAKTSTMQ
jgi:integrase